jgi:hypothetical protein
MNLEHKAKPTTNADLRVTKTVCWSQGDELVTLLSLCSSSVMQFGSKCRPKCSTKAGNQFTVRRVRHLQRAALSTFTVCLKSVHARVTPVRLVMAESGSTGSSEIPLRDSEDRLHSVMLHSELLYGLFVVPTFQRAQRQHRDRKTRENKLGGSSSNLATGYIDQPLV